MKTVYLRKAGYLLLILVLSFLGFSGCGRKVNQEEDEKKKIIAVSTIGPTHSWAEGVLSYARLELEQVAERNNWDYICVVGNDSNEQSEQVIELVEQKVDCIIMLPMDGASLKTAAIIVQNAGIPLVIFDREIPDFAPTATVKGDNSGIGIETAVIFNKMFPEGTKVLELMGDTSTVPFQRTDGYDETINPNFTKEQIGYTDWQREDTKTLFRNWIHKQSQEELDKVGAIFTHDDEIVLGVLDVLKEYEENENSTKEFGNLKVIAGSSGSQEMFHKIKEENRYDLVSLTYSPKMIREAIRIGEKIIKGEDYEEMVIIDTIEVNKDNVEEFLDADAPF